jgi:hypothetical protein
MNWSVVSLDMGMLVMVSNYHKIGRRSQFQPGNLHLNVIASEYNQRVTEALEPFVYELVGE